MGEMDEVVAEFLAESREGLDSLDRDFVTLEANPNDAQTLARIFRCAHTIKGTAGFLGFSRLESVTHAGESLLSRLRDGELKLSPEMTSSLLSMVDAVRIMLKAVETTGADGNEDHSELVGQLHRLLNGDGGEEAEAHAEPEAAPAAAHVAAEDASEAFEVRPTAPAAVPAMAPAAPPPAPAAIAHEPDASHPASAPEAAHPETATQGVGQGTETIRVDVQLIDRLMDLAGELVLTRNQILQINTRSEDSAFSAASQRLNLITAELQDGIMKMRMMPIDNVFSKFPRIVRDLSRACNKKIRIEIDGKNTELDKTLIEAIKDPLTHLLRNAVDHGIEPPEERVRKGKPAEGVLTVRAFHESGQVHVTIADDGGGIPLDKVRQKALSRNLVAPEALAKMTDEDLCNLIFLPGFSTAQTVTNVSGRGVGMDVVKTNVEKIGGTVTVDTRLNAGTTFGIKIPLTLAIVPALIVAAGRGRFAIPQVSLLELVGFDPARDVQKIENFHGAPVFRLRGQLLPLVFLDHEIGQATGGFNSGGSVRIVVLQVADRRFGLVVDRIIDQQEIVVKPLARQVKGIPIFAGATILGDGRVALILDTMGLAQQARIVSDLRNSNPPPSSIVTRKEDGDLVTMLLLKSPDDGRMALPLEKVSRLETVLPSAVENVGGQLVLRHGSDIMPLVSVNAVIPERRTVFRNDETPKNTELPLNLVVVQRNGVPVGMIVDDILDVVDISLKTRRVGSRPGITGCVVIHDRVTELLDLDWVLSNVVIGDEPEQVSA
jgi:two-component system chemotaxis sensor kinase CheA